MFHSLMFNVSTTTPGPVHVNLKLKIGSMLTLFNAYHDITKGKLFSVQPVCIDSWWKTYRVWYKHLFCSNFFLSKFFSWLSSKIQM